MQKYIQSLHELADGLNEEARRSLSSLPPELQIAILERTQKVRISDVADAVCFVLNKSTEKLLSTEHSITYLKKELKATQDFLYSQEEQGNMDDIVSKCRINFLTREIAAQEAFTQELTRALAYGNESNNYLPALLLAGDFVTVRNLLADSRRERYAVPADWNPTKEAESEPA